jgi:ribosome-associated protein
MRDVEIASDHVTLGQLLKLASLAGSGGEARLLIGEGDVRVNGEVELRRGRKLRAGDVVAVPGQEPVAVRAGGEASS